MSRVPRLTITAKVTQAHGQTFTDAWYGRTLALLEMVEAFEETGLMVWPGRRKRATRRYEDIVDEIYERVFTALRPSVAEAFVRIANEVLTRERDR